MLEVSIPKNRVITEEVVKLDETPTYVNISVSNGLAGGKLLSITSYADGSTVTTSLNVHHISMLDVNNLIAALQQIRKYL